MFLKLKKLLPFLLVVLIALIIAVQNINIHTYYSGWDNVHPEFNLTQYAYRTFFGAWVEYQGLGAPAAQSQLSEISRLPIIFFLKLLVPDNLNRYVFIFLMYLTGGVGMFLYLKKIWLNNLTGVYRDWVASFGAFYYLLNLVTLQQFFIAFEMFTVQFAFFPFLLLAIHYLNDKINVKSVLIFVLVQFLIAPSANTPTVFYIGAIFSIGYGFFLNLSSQKKIFSAARMAVSIGLLTFFTNSYWIIPNLYYLVQNAHYVTSSRANALFDPESLWAVREAGNLVSFITGAHYLFNWQDFNFSNLKQVYIFDVWRNYISEGLVPYLLTFFGLLTIGGFISALLDFKKGAKRWGIVAIYFVTVVAMWMGVLMPDFLSNFIYSLKPIQDAFRNPVTKFAVLYSFAITVMISQFYGVIINRLRGLKFIFLGLSFTAVIYVAWPSFTGNFINPKLKIIYPPEYTEMFAYLKTQPADSRILELPFFSQAGWNYYNWPLNDKGGNGYQGLGFYFFGFPQPFLTPDFARWEETNDSFYFELRQAINSEDSNQLKMVFEKYRINLIIFDKTAIDQYNKNYNYEKLSQLLGKTGARVIWKKDFLSIYGVSKQPANEKLIVPSEINLVSADTIRVRTDYAFENIGEYIETDQNKAKVVLPFANLTSLQLNDAKFDPNKISIERNIAHGDYYLKIPGIKSDTYTTPVAITTANHQLRVIFPKTKIVANNQEIELPQFENMTIPLSNNSGPGALIINHKLININRGQTIYAEISAGLNTPVEIRLPSGAIVTDQKVFNQSWQDDMILDLGEITAVKIETQFPATSVDLKTLSSTNCSWPFEGTTKTVIVNGGVTYVADGFGVNCSGYNADFLKPDYPYLMQTTGKNDQGRSMKFFVNYNVQNSVPEEFLLPQNNFSTTYVLVPILPAADLPYAINWETRSFGKEDMNKLFSLKFWPFDVDRLSQLQFFKKNTPLSFKNEVVVNKEESYFNFLYLINTSCRSGQCYLGINQSYDSMWLAIDSNFNLLPHYRYNNWANIWQLNQSGTIFIIYLPEVISLFCIFLVGSVTLVLIFIILKRYNAD